MKRTVLGCLPYLNLRPLIRSLEQQIPEGFELVYDTPAGLAGLLRAGQCDIAAVSSFEALNNPDLEILPGFSIASDGKVCSVLLFSKVPFDQVRSVALDTSSLSGAALTRIILRDLWNLTPHFVPMKPDPVEMLSHADACLMIGNNAMVNAPDVPFVMDLGEAWKELTDLPFVFGVWAARRGAADSRDLKILNDARQAGMREIDTIAQEETQKLGLPESVIRNYLVEIMVYTLDTRELEGLSTFCQKAKDHGLLDSSASVRLWSPVRVG